jgi:predicted MFS family arabinose efflux permease
VRNPGRFDFTGAAGLGAALVCLLLAISQGSDWGWTSPAVLGLLVAAVAVTALWWRQQMGAREPLVDLRLAKRPRVALPHLTALVVGFAFYANSLVTAQLLQAPEATGYGLGLSIFATGLCMLPSGLIMLALSPVSARISAARGPKITLALGAAVIATGYATRIVDSRHMWMIIVGAAVVSVGTTLAYSALPTLILQAVPASQTASANGVNVLLRTIGQATCSAAVAALLTHHTTLLGGTAVPTLHGYLMAFGMAGTVALLGCALALAIPRPRPAAGLPRQRGEAAAASPAGTALEGA